MAIVFKEQWLAEQILKGIKQYTRRPVHIGQSMKADPVRVVSQTLEGRDHTTYAVGQSRGIKFGMYSQAAWVKHEGGVFKWITPTKKHNQWQVDLWGKVYEDYKAALLDTGFMEPKLAILSIGREPLANLSEAGAITEGFVDVKHFRNYWRSLYGSIDFNQQVWIIQINPNLIFGG